jgi:hypothetical protein
MSATWQSIEIPAVLAPRLSFRLPASRGARPGSRRSAVETCAPFLIFALLLLVGLIWMAVGATVMRGTKSPGA